MRTLRNNMRNGTKCIVQTINPSNTKACVRPRQAQKFVSADVTDCRPDSNRVSNYWTPRPMAVRVCSRKDMQRICQPKICDYPRESPPLSSGEKLCRTVMFLIKGAVTAGLIYWTCSEGLWGDSAETEDLYYRMMSAIAPSLAGRPDADNTRLPYLEGVKYSALEAYNHTLMRITDIIVGVPLEMRRKLRDLLFPCDATEEMRTTSSKHIDLNRTEIY